MFAFHDHTVCGDVSALADFRTIERHRGTAQSRVTADDDSVRLENPILEGMGLKHRVHRRAVLNDDHVWIHDLREPRAEDHPLAELHAHRPQVPVEQQGSLQLFQKYPRVLPPSHVKKIPAAAPTGPQRVLAGSDASE